MCESILEFDWNVWNSGANGDFIPDKNCNSFVVYNTGAAGTVVSVNNIPLPVGSSIALGGNKGEIFKGRVNVVFTTPGAGQQVTIVQKFYTPGCLEKLFNT